MFSARPPADPRPRPPWGAKGAFAFLTAVLCLVAQVGGAAHLALVSHVRCFEHDALVHAGGNGHGTDHDARAALQPLAAGSAASGVPDGSAQHADDHCAVVGLRRREHWRPSPTPVGLAEPPRLGTVTVAPPRRQILAPPVALLRLAPKASPPVTSGRC